MKEGREKSREKFHSGFSPAHWQAVMDPGTVSFNFQLDSSVSVEDAIGEGSSRRGWPLGTSVEGCGHRAGKACLV